MLKRAQSPKKMVELYGRGEMATMESWVEVRIFCYFFQFSRIRVKNAKSYFFFFFFAIENIISYWFFFAVSK